MWAEIIFYNFFLVPVSKIISVQEIVNKCSWACGLCPLHVCVYTEECMRARIRPVPARAYIIFPSCNRNISTIETRVTSGRLKPIVTICLYQCSEIRRDDC